MTTTTTLVTGATGKTGRRVATRLTALGHQVRAGSRRGTPPFDWNDPGTWTAALTDTDSVYLVYYPDLAFPGAADTVAAFVRATAATGTRRLVLLSGRGEEQAQLAEQAMAAALAGGDTAWTVLRCSWFAQNFSEHFLLGPVLDGEIALPAGDVGEPFIDAEDIADAAVVALTEDGHGGRTYELTGPRLMSFADAAEEISHATGRTIRFTQLSAEEYAAAARAAGVPAEQIAPLTDLFTRVLDGRNAHTTDHVRHVLGRPARDFREYAESAAASGVWTTNPEAVR